MSITRSNANKELVDSDYTESFLAESKNDVEDAYLQSIMNKVLGTFTETQKTNTSFRDDTYMDGSLARQDYTVGTTQGQAIVAKLEADWADEVPDYSAHATNLVAEFTPNRLPYTNDSITWYNFEEPSSSLKTTFSLDYNAYNNWYGLKFDKVTKEVMIKVVLDNDEFVAQYGEPNLGSVSLPHWLAKKNGRFFARLHKKDGTYDDHYDIYIHAPVGLFKEWADENSLTFPYDTTSIDLKDNILCWGITVKESTNEIKHLKAYARNYL